MLQLAVGGLLPTLVAAVWGPKLSDLLEQQRQQQSQQQHRWRLGRAAARAGQTWRGLNMAVHETFADAELPALQRTVLAWMLLAYCWLAAKALAARPAAEA